MQQQKNVGGLLANFTNVDSVPSHVVFHSTTPTLRKQQKVITFPICLGFHCTKRHIAGGISERNSVMSGNCRYIVRFLLPQTPVDWLLATDLKKDIYVFQLHQKKSF